MLRNMDMIPCKLRVRTYLLSFDYFVVGHEASLSFGR